MSQRRRRRCQTWVSQDFHDLLKEQAARERVSVIDFTQSVTDFVLDPTKARKKKR